MDSIPLKPCSKCGEEKQATAEFFDKKKGGLYGLNSACKICRKAYREVNREAIREQGKAYREVNRERVIERKRRYYEANREAVLHGQRQYNQNNREAIRERKKARYEVNREAILESQKRYYEENRDTIRERQRLAYAANIEVAREGNRRRNKANRHMGRERYRRWVEANPEKQRVLTQRRAARIRGLPYSLSSENWNRALDYFHGCCAVCSRQLNDLLGTHKAAADHWIPLSLSDCPGTVPTNIVPLCHGEGGCNNRKNDSEPIYWLNRTFGKRKAKQILERIQAYFEWVEQEGE